VQYLVYCRLLIEVQLCLLRVQDVFQHLIDENEKPKDMSKAKTTKIFLPSNYFLYK
jgi:hypothetical protein